MLGGIGEMLSMFLQENGVSDVKIETFEYEDSFITHGKTYDVEQSLGLLPPQLAERVKSKISKPGLLKSISTK